MGNEKDLFDNSIETDLSGMDSGDGKKKKELLFLARMLRNMPDQDPPGNLMEQVLRSVRPKRISAWQRLYLWAVTPRSITISPMRLIPALSVAVILVLLGMSHYLAGHKIPMRSQGQSKLVPVVFSFHDPQARSVSVIGSFNEWNPKGFEMYPKEGEKTWTLELRLPEGEHEYAFLVDGKLVVADPNSPFSKSDGFGGRNSLIFVINNHEKTT